VRTAARHRLYRGCKRNPLPARLLRTETNAFSRGVPKHGVVGRVDHDIIKWMTRRPKVLRSLSIIGWPARSQRPGVPVQFVAGQSMTDLFLRHAFRLLCVPLIYHLHARKLHHNYTRNNKRWLAGYDDDADSRKSHSQSRQSCMALQVQPPRLVQHTTLQRATSETIAETNSACAIQHKRPTDRSCTIYDKPSSI